MLFRSNPALHSKPPYDVLKEFEPVMLMANQGSMITLHPSVPARNVRELIALAKARPGQLNYGTAGAGSNPHIGVELFTMLTGASMSPVHFKGGEERSPVVRSGRRTGRWQAYDGPPDFRAANRSTTSRLPTPRKAAMAARFLPLGREIGRAHV